MLRIKRSVQAQYNTDVNFIASQALARSYLRPDGELDESQTDRMAALEPEARALQGFIPASSGPRGGSPKMAQTPTNPDTINVDDMDDN
jgi:pre-mRNA-splicing factor SYF1